MLWWRGIALGTSLALVIGADALLPLNRMLPIFHSLRLHHVNDLLCQFDWNRAVSFSIRCDLDKYPVRQLISSVNSLVHDPMVGLSSITHETLCEAQTVQPAFTSCREFDSELISKARAANVTLYCAVGSIDEIDEAIDSRCAALKIYPVVKIGPQETGRMIRHARARSAAKDAVPMSIMLSGGVDENLIFNFRAVDTRDCFFGVGLDLKKNSIAHCLNRLDLLEKLSSKE